MPAQILDGKAVAKAIKEKLAAEFAALKFKPKLVSFAVGVDDGTTSYRKSQKKQAEALGVAYEMVDLPADASRDSVVSRLRDLNGDKAVTGIILQLPVPKHLNGEELARQIAPQKNIEGIDEVNLGAIVMKKYRNIPCTARAAVELAAHSGVDLNGANASSSAVARSWASPRRSCCSIAIAPSRCAIARAAISRRSQRVPTFS